MTLLFLVLFVFLLTSLYKRYIPVKNVPCLNDYTKESNVVSLDIRSYNQETNDLNKDTLNIPYAYLKRYSKDIPKGNIHVIASDRLELNLGIRLLKSKGMNVTSYEIREVV